VSPVVRRDLTDGWMVAGSDPGACAGPGELDRLHFIPAVVPGTAAAAVGDDALDYDARDWWFTTRFHAEPAAAGETVALGLEGLATVAEVYLNGELVLSGESMFAGHELDVGARLRGDNELVIGCRALHPLLAARRRPRARWRTRLVTSGNLRFYRTMLLGRAPGFAPGPAVVGPWRPVWLQRCSGRRLEAVALRARVRDDVGVVSVAATLRGAREALALDVGEHRVALSVDAVGRVSGELRIPDCRRWWPHTHGEPALHDVAIAGDEGVLHRGRVGFRTLEAPDDLATDGPALTINGVDVFCRGAVWTPPSLRKPSGDRAHYEPVLRRLTAGGLNMLRVPGTAAYESDAFYDLCDELGILVWQDFMFANLDYPESEPEFLDGVAREAREQLSRIAGRPSLAVLCGGSEVAQQVAMLGLDPALAHGPLFGEVLPAAVADADVDAPYVPSAPWGGELPFRTDRGVAHYFGVGAYRRPLADARLAEVRFAAESLAFANLSDEPEPDLGVPRDAGADWDFADVRDHYLRELFGLDPAHLRTTDPARYRALSRVVSGEVMAETFGEWRRAASPCRGALVLWSKDLEPGAGWGLLDHRGEPKVAFRHVARALAPVATWTTDEGLGGIDVHVANDRGLPLRAHLRVALYRDFALRVEESVTELELAARGWARFGVEALLGRFVDVSWAYRFGAPAQDLVAVSLLDADGELLSQAFRFPVGRPLALGDVGLRGRLQGTRLVVAADRFAYGVRVHAAGFDPSDDAFGVEPGGERTIELRGGAGPRGPAAVTLTALNAPAVEVRAHGSPVAPANSRR